jgi:integrase
MDEVLPLRLGLVHRNVAELATIPRSEVTSKQRRALTVEQWRTLYATTTGATKLLVDLCGRHGLRPQEARALQWSSVDLDQGELSVVTQLDSEDQHVAPKTTQATRTIHAHPELVDELQRWQAWQQQVQTAGGRWADPNLVLATRVGTPVRQENQRRALTAACEAAGVEPITPYELRHTALTHQVEARHPVSQIADWAGTSEKMIYQHYRHQLREVVGLRPPDF